MDQKEASKDQNPVHPDSSVASTAPEVPRSVAKEFGVHNEALHKTTAHVAPAPADQLPQTENSLIDNPETNAAVDDIVNKESDELLAIQATDIPQLGGKQHSGHRLKRFFKRWWNNKPARYSTLTLLIAGIVTVAVIPKTRYAVLNTVGVRSSASVIVLDDTTQLPLKNVKVTVGSTTTETDRNGVARVTNLKLGDYQLTVKRIAFAPYRQTVTIGWGSNPLGKVSLRAVGTQYSMIVKDYLSGKPIMGAEAESPDGINALSDRDGKITLTVADTNITSLKLSFNAPGYRTEQLQLSADSSATTTITLTSSQKTVFASKESGKYDVYTSYIDGKDKKLLLAGTGLETSNSSLVVSPDNSQAVLVSTRDNIRDSDGYLLYALTFIAINEGTSTTIDHAQQIQLVDWLNGRLIYRSTIAGASAANAQRNRLIAYTFAANARTQLATANQFNAVLSADGFVYYSASSTDPGASLGLFKVKTDGTGRERLTNREVWTALRTDPQSFRLQTPEGWLSYDLASKKTQPSSPPTVFSSLYIAANSKNDLAWTDTQDGKGTILLKLAGESQPKKLVSQSGATNPIHWLTDKILVYRVSTANETADYAIHVVGGAAHKVADVSATYGYLQAN